MVVFFLLLRVSKLALQIQKYVGGNIIYIPQKDNNKKSWGTSTDSRSEIIERNNEIEGKQ